MYRSIYDMARLPSEFLTLYVKTINDIFPDC